MARGLWRFVRVAGVFAALTAVMTWPQVLHLASRATPHQDVYFNMWRLRWFAHALATEARLFDANIFFPERRTLALSDAMFVEGLLMAPLTWLGLNPVLVHNLALLGAITLSGAAIFALVRYLTGSRGAGVIAGLVFCFAPYRFEHYMHMELQWAMWAPLAFLALHRAYDTGRWRHGLAAGACVALQMLSSIYYGMFLAVLLGIAAVLLFPRDRRAPARAVTRVMIAGAIVAAIASGLYARPYVRNHEKVGDRPIAEVSMFRATAASYTSATSGNWLYGSTAYRGGPERHLFPGLTPLFLAMIGLLLQPPGRRAIVYLLLLVAAFEMSFGLRGYLYSFLYEYGPPFRGLRASARLALFVLLFLGVLAGYGYAALAANRSRAQRIALFALLTAAVLAEYRTSLVLAEFPNEAPPIYRILSRQPRGVVAEFPVPGLRSLPGADAEYAYLSTFHWFPIVNGYSGYYPPSYLERIERLADFPSERALRQLKLDTVQYVIVHAAQYKPTDLNEIRARLQNGGQLLEVGSFEAPDGPAFLYRMR
ncbi:MAG TPA: hypothetical protein VFK57_16210 [Vicinamibacterales bacterium]|nr:hypothetical protein [Vicinamibacterales bacterium]